MNSPLDFFVDGIPAPQGSKKAFLNRTGTISLVESSLKVKPWRAAVAWTARTNRSHDPLSLILGPVKVTLFFLLPRPKSLPKKTVHHIKKPDLDKLIRSTLDGLTDSGVIWLDDSQVVSVEAVKRYPTADRTLAPTLTPRLGCRIMVEELA